MKLCVQECSVTVKRKVLTQTDRTKYKTKSSWLITQYKTKSSWLVTQYKTKSSWLITQYKTKSLWLITKYKTKSLWLITQYKTKSLWLITQYTTQPDSGSIDISHSCARTQSPNIPPHPELTGNM